MRSVNDRVVYLEGRMEDHTALMADIRGEMRDLRSEMRTDMANLRSTVEGGFSRLDQKIDRHFMWLVGLLIGAFATLIGIVLRS